MGLGRVGVGGGFLLGQKELRIDKSWTHAMPSQTMRCHVMDLLKYFFMFL